jgi:hypothetical protein
MVFWLLKSFALRSYLPFFLATGGDDYLARAEEISSLGASIPAATAHKKAA